MAEITHPDYPGERLIACYNPFLEADRARQRAELLDATEAELEKISTARAVRPSPVAPAGRSPSALAKYATKATADGRPCTASPPYWTTWPPSPPTASSPPAACLDSPSSPRPHRPAPRLRAARRLPPPRARVVRQHQIAARFRRQAPYSVPSGGKFGLGIGWTRVQRGTRYGAALPRRTLDVQPWQPLEPAREVPVPRPEELHRGR
jgi:hypothetical protein